MLLVIGNKNYSSWSLRSWIALKMLGVPVDKKRIALRRPETKAEILRSLQCLVLPSTGNRARLELGTMI